MRNKALDKVVRAAKADPRSKLRGGFAIYQMSDGQMRYFPGEHQEQAATLLGYWKWNRERWSRSSLAVVPPLLYLFDLDGTIISSYMDNPTKDYHTWQLLPGRRERLTSLTKQGHTIGIVTNQDGVAFGLITEDDFVRKIGLVADALGIGSVDVYDGRADGCLSLGWGHELPVFVCYSDSRAKDTRYHEDAYRRKPSGAMIVEATKATGLSLSQTIYIGDRPEDEQAARSAGVAFSWADAFFVEPV